MNKHKLRKIGEIFQKVQHSISCHQKCVKILQNLYKESNPENFFNEFLRYLLQLLLENTSSHNPFVERTISFCVVFCTSLKTNAESNDEETTCPFLAGIFSKVLKLHNSDDGRYRACQFINQLLKKLGEDESLLEEQICDNIRDVMLERILDLKPAVRIQAIEALQRLQDPQDTNDPIIKSYINSLQDSSPQVRKAIVQCIGLNMTTIPVILARCLDVDDSVRVSAYDKFCKIPVKALKLEHRQYILRNGFKDKNQRVQQFISSTLLPQWFQNCNQNYFQFIRALKLDADENDFKNTLLVVEKALNVFFKEGSLKELMEVIPLGEEKLITSVINWEEIVYWRCLTNFLNDQDDDNEYCEQILPELSYFCTYILRVYKTRSDCKTDWELMQHDHIMLELLKMLETFDYSDEVGRRALLKLITDLLTDAKLSFENILILVQIFEKLVPSFDERTNKISGIIGEIREPLTAQAPTAEMMRKRDMQLAEIRVKLNIAVDDQETAIAREEYAKAEELKHQIKELQATMQKITSEFEDAAQVRVSRNDASTLCKCLDILVATMLSVNIRTLSPAIRECQEQFVQPLLVSAQPEIFSRALKFYGLCCMFDEPLARKTINLFCTPLLAHKYIPTYDENTTIVAISCVADMIMLYGKDVFVNEDNNETNVSTVTKKRPNKRQLFTDSQIEETIASIPSTTSYEEVIEILSDMLDDDNPDIREKSGDAIVKLMCSGIVRTAMLLSKLILKWYSPATAKDVRLRQLIGCMFVEYAEAVPGSLEVIEQAFLPTLAAIVDAPSSSPLADVDIDSTLRFLVELSRPGRHRDNVGLDTHKNIAFLLCQELCDKPYNKYTSVYLKALISLDPPYEDKVALNDLHKQADVMLELMNDSKHVQKYVQKYKFKLDGDLRQSTSITRISTSDSTTVGENTQVVSEQNGHDQTDVFNGRNSTNTNDRTSTISNDRHSTDTNDTSIRYSSLQVKRKKQRGKLTLINHSENLPTVLEGSFENNEENADKNHETNDSVYHLNGSRILTRVSETDSDNVPAKSTRQLRKRPGRKKQ